MKILYIRSTCMLGKTRCLGQKNKEKLGSRSRTCTAERYEFSILNGNKNIQYSFALHVQTTL